MSLISLNQKITNIIPVSGEGNATYTCPQDRRSLVTVTMLLSIVKSTYSFGSNSIIEVFPHISRSYVFNVEVKGGDIVMFVESGEGSTLAANTTIGTSFSINAVNVAAKTLSFTNEFVSEFIQSSVKYNANISYSAIEYPA